MKGLRFTVPLLRFVIPLDSLQPRKSGNAKGRDQTAHLQKSPIVPPQTLLRLIRIETPLESLLLNKHTAPPTADWTLLQQALKKKTRRKPKASNARHRPPSSRLKRK